MSRGGRPRFFPHQEESSDAGQIPGSPSVTALSETPPVSLGPQPFPPTGAQHRTVEMSQRRELIAWPYGQSSLGSVYRDFRSWG